MGQVGSCACTDQLCGGNLQREDKKYSSLSPLDWLLGGVPGRLSAILWASAMGRKAAGTPKASLHLAISDAEEREVAKSSRVGGGTTQL